MDIWQLKLVNSSFFTDISNLKTENEELKNQNSKLEQSLRELENI